MAMAAQTRRLIVGISVILLPLHHPVHLAEDVTRLDLISKGRVILGVGIGYVVALLYAWSEGKQIIGIERLEASISASSHLRI